MILALPAKGQQNLNPNNGGAHANLGLALAAKGDWDGDIAEEREVLRLNPNSGNAHYLLGAWCLKGKATASKPWGNIGLPTNSPTKTPPSAKATSALFSHKSPSNRAGRAILSPPPLMRVRIDGVKFL
jgi:tetratricopeptide (TPR) repeat protein